jgi:hypothetical protein
VRRKRRGERRNGAGEKDEKEESWESGTIEEKEEGKRRTRRNSYRFS